MKYSIAALLLAVSAGAGANDAIGSVAAGGIVLGRTDAVAMKKEVLDVGHDRITVDYEFLNESEADVEETVIFPMPPYPVSEQGGDAHYGQPGAFKVTVDGKDVRSRTVVRALVDGKDVTAQLRKAGLSDPQIAYGDMFGGPGKIKVPPLSAQQRRQLQSAKLLAPGMSGDLAPQWEAQVSYVWQQAFPRNRIVRVHHEYQPLVGAGPAESAMDRDAVKRYCADPAFLNSWNKLVARARKGQGDYPGVAEVDYILTSGNTWKRGIEDFTLNVVKSGAGELVTLCFPGTFAKIDAKTYQVRLRNFHPTHDLAVFFGNTVSSDDTTGAEPPRLSK